MKIERKYLTVPLTAQLEITDFCNHKCVHCYNLDSKIENRPDRKVTDEIVLSCAQKLIDSKIFAVVVTGGEPLINKDLAKKVITLFRKNNVSVSLNSNLTLLDDDFITFLKETNITILTSCPSSIPTSFEKLSGTDNYTRFMTNIKKLFLKGVWVTVNMVVTKDNLHEIRTTAEKMKELGCKSFTATPMGLNMNYPRLDLLLSIEDAHKVIDDLLWIEKTLSLNVDILTALPKCMFSKKILNENHSFLKRKCQAGRTIIAVSCNGDVRPCVHNSISYGNILEEDLKTIWAKMADWRSLQYIPLECKDCIWLNRCNGGCRTNAKTTGGEWNSKESLAIAPLEIPLPEGKHIELKFDTILQVNPNYKYRQEDETGFVVYNITDNTYFMVNKIYCNFIVGLKDNVTFTFGDLLKEYNENAENKDFYNVILFLIQKNIIKIVV